jgi:bifunctional UDP-N-acetylglucosamine pyrophosphorylase/glucosamine-1-phosphate N-acetyltransferase
MNQRIGAIVLAAGRGTRLNSNTINKVALPFRGKPIIEYAVDVMEAVAEPVVVVVGAFAESVKDVLKGHPAVVFAMQDEQLGTGHAARVGFEALEPNLVDSVFIGYGDHMMFYKPDTILNLRDTHVSTHADLSLLTTIADDPESLAWGHIIRDKNGKVDGIVEHKDATEEQKHIKEVNPGFYLCSTAFLRESLPNLHKSETTGEYYLTELIQIAVKRRLTVNGVAVPFQEVGIGINRKEELEQSQKLHETVRTGENTV